MTWLSFIDNLFKSARSTAIFALAGFAGSLFSIVVSGGDTKTAGVATGVFGIFGAGAAYLVFNWQKMGHAMSPR